MTYCLRHTHQFYDSNEAIRHTYQVYDDNGIIAVFLTLPCAEVWFIEQEGCYVGREDGGVHDKQEDDPVPDGLERTVVKDCPFVNAWGLELVLWQDVGSQRQHLWQETTK